jgi:hypothetical protein
LDSVDSLRELWIESPAPKMVKVTSKEGFETYQWVQDAASDLKQELSGYLPTKVRRITISGPGFNKLADGIFDVRKNYLTFKKLKLFFYREFNHHHFT